MQYGKTTKVTLYEDRPTGISSRMYGANLDVIGFNVDFIASRDPNLAVQLMQLYYEAVEIKKDSPKISKEAYERASKQLKELMKVNRKDRPIAAC